MQHHPYAVFLVDFKLNEVIARAECSHLKPPVHVLHRIENAGIFGFDFCHLVGKRQAHFRTAVLLSVLCQAHRRATQNRLKCGDKLVFCEFASLEIEFDGGHTASDVHADGCRNHSTSGGNHTSDGRTHTDVNVGHGSDVMKYKRQISHIRELSDGTFVNVVCPYLDGHARRFNDLLDWHFSSLFSFVGSSALVTLHSLATTNDASKHKTSLLYFVRLFSKPFRAH